MSSLRPDSHNSSPDHDVDDPVVTEPENPPRPLVSFNSRNLFRGNMISLSWRCLTTVLFLSLLILGLGVFSRMGELSQMQQRWFNAIAILLGALTSLGLGSILGYLGSMLRWRLLAREKYKMQDIELLLSMPSPRGSAALIFSHFRGRRFSRTTFIAMLYLLVNIIGRFSVAIFGLTYNLIYVDIALYAEDTTNWTSSVLLTKNATDPGVVEKSLLSYLDFVRGGLTKFGSPPDIELDTDVPHRLTESTFRSLAPSHSEIENTGGNVSFKYHIVDFEERGFPKRSGHAVHSSATCTMFRLDGHKYWEDYVSDSQTSKDWKDEGNGETIAEVLRVLDSKNAWPRKDAGYATWAAPLVVGSKGPSVTYVVYKETAWECTSSLSETERGKRHLTPLFDSASLFLLPIAERAETGRGQELVDDWGTSCSSAHVDRTASILYRPFTDLNSQTSPSIGVQTLNFYQNGTGGSTTQKGYYNLYVAALIARLPIAAIAYGNVILPMGTNEEPDSDLPTTGFKTMLQVEWSKASAVTGAIVAGQILVITAVLYYCRNVYVRDDSHLTTAELLQTVLNKIDDGNMMNAKELGDALDKVLGGPVSYGTIPGSHGDQPSVALGCEVDYNFPEFPPSRKRSVFRR